MSIPFDPKEVIAAVGEDVERIVHDVASKVLGTVVLSTPVGAPGTWLSPPPPDYRPGHARGSWQTTLKDTVKQDNRAIDPGGARTIADGVRIIRRAKFGQNIFITSAAPYMPRLNQGWSRQAGANFVERAARRGATEGANETRTLPRSVRVRPRARRS